MTHEELQAIKARAEAATPGPWRIKYEGTTRSMRTPARCMQLMNDHPDHPWPPQAESDWQFIAHARTDIPALLDEIERLRAENYRLQDYAATIEGMTEGAMK